MPVLHSIIPRCSSTAQRAASTTLGNSTSSPSPVVLTMRPCCSVIFGSTSSRRSALRRSCVPSSSAPIKREYPTTSAARIAARRRVAVVVAIARAALTPRAEFSLLRAGKRQFHLGWLRARELQDVEPGVIVGEIHDTLRIDKAIAGLDHSRPVGTRVEHMLGIGRHEEPDFARLEWVFDVEDPHTGIVIGRED